MSESTTKSVPRREFLMAAGLTTGAVGAAAVALTSTPARAAKDQAVGTKHAGYRETEHVLKYYETARF